MLLRPKKVVLSPEIDPVKILSFTHPHSGMLIRTNINLKTIEIINNRDKKQKQLKKKRYICRKRNEIR